MRGSHGPICFTVTSCYSFIDQAIHGMTSLYIMISSTTVFKVQLYPMPFLADPLNAAIGLVAAIVPFLPFDKAAPCVMTDVCVRIAVRVFEILETLYEVCLYVPSAALGLESLSLLMVDVALPASPFPEACMISRLSDPAS